MQPRTRQLVTAVVLVAMALSVCSCGSPGQLQTAAGVGVEIKRSAERAMVECYKLHAEGHLDDEQLRQAEGAYLRIRALLITYANTLATIQAADGAAGDPGNSARLDQLQAELTRTMAALLDFVEIGRATCPFLQR